jgi:hypothetical protein
MIYDDIKQQFKAVIQFSQELPHVEIDQLFDQWLEAKRDIIEAFGGKLIYEVEQPVHFHLDEPARARAFSEFVSQIQTVYHNTELVNFLTANNVTGFFDNIVMNAYEDGDIKVPVGMKLVKAFKYFEKDKNLLEVFQNLASRVIQEDRVVGKLCFSVHPLDFLSTSVNTYNWRSCHALDGEFRAGNLSYMLDSSTIVCYVKGENGDVELPMFPPEVPWNSKKWRVLLYLSEKWDMIFASKQYPFATDGGLDIVRGWLLQILKLQNFSEWYNDYVDFVPCKRGDDKHYLSCSYMPIYSKLYPIDDIVEDGEGALQFNDLLNSSTYKEPYYAIKENFWWDSHDGAPHFKIGKSVPCLCCGKNRLKSSDMMVCNDCAEEYNLFPDDTDYPVCACCGDTIYNGDWFCVEGETVCGGCMETEVFLCDCCGEYYFNEQKNYERATNKYLCCDCYNEERDEE